MKALNLPPRPTQAQLKHQAQILDSFLPSSSPLSIERFALETAKLDYLHPKLQPLVTGSSSSIGAPAARKDFSTPQLQESCSLTDLIAPLSGILKDPNIISELRDYQHEMVTPYGTLHSMNTSEIEGSPDSHPPSKKIRADVNEAREKSHDSSISALTEFQQEDIPVTSDAPGYLDPSLVAAMSSSSHDKKNGKSNSRRQRKRSTGLRQSIASVVPTKPQPILELAQKLSGTGLETLQPNFDGMWYLQSMGQSEVNISKQPMFSSFPTPVTCSSQSPPVILTITFHPRPRCQENLPKSFTTRKQIIHILSTQTLADLRDVMNCVADRIPQTSNDRWIDGKWEAGSVIMIENVLFGDRRKISGSTDKLDYGLLLHQLAPSVIQLPSESVTTTCLSNDPKIAQVSQLGMEDVQFMQLTVRIGEPYWLMHQGNCEHLFTIDEIRAIHHSDPKPSAGSNPYPITTFLSRLRSRNCKICERDPASLAILDDELVPESPCHTCLTCFKLLHGHKEGVFRDGEDDKKIAWGKVEGRTWWVIPLMGFG